MLGGYKASDRRVSHSISDLWDHGDVSELMLVDCKAVGFGYGI